MKELTIMDSVPNASRITRARNTDYTGIRIQKSLTNFELKFSSSTTVAGLKKQFDRCFFYLKLEFFISGFEWEEVSGMNRKMIDQLTLAEFAGIGNEGVFLFSGSTTVLEFEDRMQRELGVSVKVFRKAAELWVDTTGTNHLSLDTQNKMGEGSSKPMPGNIHNLFL